jgi:hypothetical protein
MESIIEALLLQQRAIAHLIKYVEKNVPSEDETKLSKAAECLVEAGYHIDNATRKE